MCRFPVPDMRRFSPVEATRSMCWMMASSNIKSLRIGCFTWLYDLAIVLLMVDCFFVSMRRCYLPYSSQPCPCNWTCTGLCFVLQHLDTYCKLISSSLSRNFKLTLLCVPFLNSAVAYLDCFLMTYESWIYLYIMMPCNVS